jgi:uncharacterized protein (TIGR02145 family)
MRGNKFILVFIVLIIVSCKKQDDFPATITDIDGNVYSTVKIGDQLWMAENLKTVKYKDGTPINTNLTYVDWENTTEGAFGKNNVSPGYDFNYYNWFAVNSGKLCPKGWRIPVKGDWEALGIYLGGEAVAGGKLKSTSSLWDPPNAGATNSSGFNALPSGFHYGGSTSNFHILADFWSQSVAAQNIAAYVASLNSDFPTLYTINYANFRLGLPCRCIRE